MKNLKRILSVVLVVAMAFSLVTVAGAAVEDKYTDAAQIKHAKAVDTLTELGVLNGLDDGSYGPNKTLTRAQMVKIAAYVMVNREITDGQQTDRALSLYASTVKFTDTNKGAWYMGPIGYAVARNVVAGNGMGTFSPERKVTYAEAAKMLLVALGYEPNYFRLVGDDWIVNTNRLANLNGLFDEIDAYDINDYVTRDNMAQMVFNMLEENMVVSKAVGGSTVYDLDENGKGQGDKAVVWYFRQNFTTVIEGVVVANGYANLGNKDASLVSAPEGATAKEAHFMYSTRLYDTGRFTKSDSCDVAGDNSWATAGNVAAGTIVGNKANGDVEYNALTQTVVYIPEADCYKEGNCSLHHNPNNPNCPKNNTNNFRVVNVPSGEAEIGRTVDVTFVGGGWEAYTYAYITPKDINKTEVVAAHVNDMDAKNGTAKVNALAQDIKLGEGTIVAEISVNDGTTANVAQGKFAPVEIVASEKKSYANPDPAATYGVYNAATNIDGFNANTLTPSANTAIDNIPTTSDVTNTLIDNDGDGIADYMIAVRKDLTVSAFNKVTNRVELNAFEGIDAGRTEDYDFDLPVGVELDDGTVALAYVALNGEIIYNVLEANAGTIQSTTNNTNNIKVNDATHFLSGVAHKIDEVSIKRNVDGTDKMFANTNTMNGMDIVYYLDDAGNIVHLTPAVNSIVDVLVYNIVADAGWATGQGSSTIFTGMKLDGSTETYTLANTAELNGIFDETQTDYENAYYCQLEMKNGLVVEVRNLADENVDYVLGSLVAGVYSGTMTTYTQDTIGTKTSSNTVSSVTSGKYEIDDDVNVFNFIKGRNDQGVIGIASVDKGFDKAGDSNFNAQIGSTDSSANTNDVKLYHEPVGTADDVMVVTHENGKAPNTNYAVTNPSAATKDRFVVVTNKDVDGAWSSEQVKNDAGTDGFIWTIENCKGTADTVRVFAAGTNRDQSLKNLQGKFGDIGATYKIYELEEATAAADTVLNETLDVVTLATTNNGTMGVISTDTNRAAVTDGTDTNVYTYGVDSANTKFYAYDTATESLRDITLAEVLELRAVPGTTVTALESILTTVAGEATPVSSYFGQSMIIGVITIA